MSVLTQVGIIDTMIGFKHADVRSAYKTLRANAKDRETLEEFSFPVEYMFKDVPDGDLKGDPINETLREMDKFGVQMGLVSVNDEVGQQAVKDHPDRFLATMSINPHDGMRCLQAIVDAHERFTLRAVDAMPSGLNPPLPVNDARWYPVYAKCAELGLPIFLCMGVPGPRVPLAAQRVELLDEICWFFPELTIVTRHGCEPWEELAVKLMLKWPNLYYSTSAFAPKYYPKAVIDYANTRGSDKIIYAGYYPMGLSLERIIGELETVDLREHVWPKFLRENAVRVLKLDK
jgi:predicted TIM-barrel fold metal-dependent hydrolase